MSGLSRENIIVVCFLRLENGMALVILLGEVLGIGEE